MENNKYYPNNHETAITCYYKTGMKRPDKCRTMCKIWIHDEYKADDIQIGDIMPEAAIALLKRGLGVTYLVDGTVWHY